MTWTRPAVGDAVLAAVLVVVGIVGTWGAESRTQLDRPVDTLALVLVVAAAATLAVRRRWPLGTLVVVAVLTAAYLVVGYTFGPILISFFVAVYTAARHLPLATSAPVSLAAMGVLVVHVFTNESALPGLLGVVPAAAWVVVPFAVGATMRTVQESAARERAEAVRARVDEERLRIAREVHDVVGHALAAMKMQADVALHVLAGNPAQAETALTAISGTSAEALDDLRSTLGVLRDTDSESGRAPTPGLERVAELCERIRQAGVDVTLRTEGEPAGVPAAVDLAGYRVVQEALTNVLRHGATRSAEVRVAYGEGSVAVTVSNPGTGRPAHGGAGLGIVGMRERVAAVGGRLRAEPTEGGRFEVHAWMPTGEPG